ncbi:MAG: hypothetical protein LCH26_07440 [Proteobacteria bacterium]|nr:hypothetical protein [Pseudomonadota bacterium]
MDLTLSGFIFQKEFFRFLVILFHIFAANLAVGTILFGYIHFMITQKISRKELLIEHQVVYATLLLLMLSGDLIVYLDAGIIYSFDQLMAHTKLCAKLIVVSTLLLNGFFINHHIIKKMTSGAEITKRDNTIFAISGGLSLASWLSAIFVGKAKILVGKLSLMGFMDVYIVVAIVFMLAFYLLSHKYSLVGRVVD